MIMNSCVIILKKMSLALLFVVIFTWTVCHYSTFCLSFVSHPYLTVLSVLGLSVPAQSCFLNSVRFASKKAGGSSKNLGGKSPGRRYGVKKQDGN